MKRKVLLLGYARKNVGDDLFIAMLLNRYKDINFYLRIDNDFYFEPFSNYKNCKMILTKEDILEQDMNGFVACIYVGGSIFIEYDKSLNYRKNFNQFLMNCRNSNIPFFYMSSNFGPYKTQEFYDSCMEAFSIIEGITFRDKNSYNEFKHIEQAKYVPDLVFGLHLKKGRKIKNSVGISLVDLSLPVRGEKINKIAPKYCKMLKNNIEMFINQGKEVYLFSFCEHEGDVRTIERISDLLDDKYKNKIKVVEYTGKPGNLYKFIHQYSRMEKTICTRFHSLVLSLIFKHELLVVSYSNKLNNLLNDLADNFKVVNINNNINKLIIKNDDFKQVDVNILKEFRGKAVEHFSVLDKCLNLKKRSNKLKIKNRSIKSRLIDTYYSVFM